MNDDDVYMDPEEVAKRVVPVPFPQFSFEQDQAIRKKMRRQIIIAAVVGGLGVAATTMGIIGQSFSYRSAHALERIGDQLEVLSRQRCEVVR